MSTTRISFALRAPAVRRTAFVQCSGAARSFQSCRVLAAGKETKLHEEGRADEVESHKQEQLQKQKEGKGQWKDELASESESIVKADRDELGASAQDTIKKLQEETAKLSQHDKEGDQRKHQS